MKLRGFTIDDINFEKLADFVGWLRYPTTINVIDLQPKEAVREETTVNTIQCCYELSGIFKIARGI